MKTPETLDVAFCAAYSDICAGAKEADLYRRLEEMHDCWAELLRLYRAASPERESISQPDASAPHHPAAFINVIAEEGTKEEAVRYLQETWNELCEMRRKVGKP